MKKTKTKISEVELARKVVKWLEEQKWDVYQEVEMSIGVADIVAVMNKRVWIIEAKTSFGLKVLEQADRWRKVANWISIAVPYNSSVTERDFGGKICKMFGIGVIRVPTVDWGRMEESIYSTLNRKALNHKILSKLRPEHKTYAEAGNALGARWSPFKETCVNILQYVGQKEGCTIQDILKNVHHHYASSSSARQCIVEWATKGIIEGVECKTIDGKIRFYLKEKNRRFG